jgi:hypothetical protein
MLSLNLSDYFFFARLVAAPNPLVPAPVASPLLPPVLQGELALVYVEMGRCEACRRASLLSVSWVRWVVVKWHVGLGEGGKGKGQRG